MFKFILCLIFGCKLEDPEMVTLVGGDLCSVATCSRCGNRQVRKPTYIGKKSSACCRINAVEKKSRQRK